MEDKMSTISSFLNVIVGMVFTHISWMEKSSYKLAWFIMIFLSALLILSYQE